MQQFHHGLLGIGKADPGDPRRGDATGLASERHLVQVRVDDRGVDIAFAADGGGAAELNRSSARMINAELHPRREGHAAALEGGATKTPRLFSEAPGQLLS